MYNDIFSDEHFNNWSGKLGDNLQSADPYKSSMMKSKNIETGGGYQATVSGMYGEFSASAVFKALPDEYAILDDILVQTGVKYRKYSQKEYKLFGETPWELAVRKGKQYINIDHGQGMSQVLNYNNQSIYEIVKESSQLDHVIVSPYGIFVIETKNHKGWIYGDVNGKVWTQVITGEQDRAGFRAHGNRSRFIFYNPVMQNEKHLQYLSKYTQLPRQYMIGFIVFTNPGAYLANVNCSFCMTLDQLASAIMSYRNPIWNKQQTEKVIHMIEKIDSNNYSLAKEHVQFVKDNQQRREVYTELKRRGIKP